MPSDYRRLAFEAFLDERRSRGRRRLRAMAHLLTAVLVSLGVAGLLLLLLALSGRPAGAQAPAGKMADVCAHSWCVYDSASNVIGQLQQQGIVNRQVGNTVYYLGYSEVGPTVDVTIFWSGANCTGEALMQSGYIGPDGTTPVADPPPVWAEWSGVDLWAPGGPTQVLSPQSNRCWGAPCNGNPQAKCMPYTATIGPYYPAFAPAEWIERPYFDGVTQACIDAQNCVTVK